MGCCTTKEDHPGVPLDQKPLPRELQGERGEPPEESEVLLVESPWEEDEAENIQATGFGASLVQQKHHATSDSKVETHANTQEKEERISRDGSSEKVQEAMTEDTSGKVDDKVPQKPDITGAIMHQMQEKIIQLGEEKVAKQIGAGSLADQPKDDGKTEGSPPANEGNVESLARTDKIEALATQELNCQPGDLKGGETTTVSQLGGESPAPSQPGDLQDGGNTAPDPAKKRAALGHLDSQGRENAFSSQPGDLKDGSSFSKSGDPKVGETFSQAGDLGEGEKTSTPDALVRQGGENSSPNGSQKLSSAKLGVESLAPLNGLDTFVQSVTGNTAEDGRKTGLDVLSTSLTSEVAGHATTESLGSQNTTLKQVASAIIGEGEGGKAGTSVSQDAQQMFMKPVSQSTEDHDAALDGLDEDLKPALSGEKMVVSKQPADESSVDVQNLVEVNVTNGEGNGSLSKDAGVGSPLDENPPGGSQKLSRAQRKKKNGKR